MKERPILFSPAMVQAMLEGKKSQTRRIITLREFKSSDTPGYDWTFRDHRCLWHDYKADRFVREKCPYGTVGDRLWVRESGWIDDEKRFFAYHSTPTLSRCADDPRGVFIEVAPEEVSSWSKDDYEKGGWKRCPSIHMPRWASRITIEVIEARVQRLQDISDEDILAEGIPENPEGVFPQSIGWLTSWRKSQFQKLWDSLSGKKPGCAWKENPFVWAVSFRRVDPAKEQSNA